MGGFHAQLGSFFVAVGALSVGQVCDFWAGFRILIFSYDFESE